MDKLRLEVLFAAVEKVTGPLKAMATGSKATAGALGETELALKQLMAQQRALTKFEKERDRLDEARGALEQARAIGVKRTVLKQLTADYEKQLTVVKGLQSKMAASGWANATVDQRSLATSIQATNAKLDQQRHKMEQQRQVEQRLHVLRENHSKAMMKMAMYGGAAAGAQMAGQKARVPFQAAVDAFMPAEDASTQLSASLMRADGQVPKSFKEMVDLATKLGDKLPGTTKDFIELMQALSQEGLSDKTILGGTAEAASYLAVQLKKVPKEAATMAAKMQDATRATEAEMMGILDMVQRSHYAGADADFMLAGFTKMAPVLDITKKKGLEVMNALSPMMVMLNQAGMTDGGSAGNAIRKVFQASMSQKKLVKANKALSGAKAGFSLDFSNGKGEFGGIDKMFKQLKKLDKLNTMQRGLVINELFGDDAETLQVVNTLITKGADGYQEAAKKLADQASLQMRVNEQLKTLTNAAEAAQGSFTNMLAEFGQAIAPELKAILGWLGDVANGIGAWARANPGLAKGIMMVVGGAAALLTVGGALGIGILALLGPMTIARFLLSRFLLNLVATRVAAAGAAPAVGLLGRLWAGAGNAVGGALGWFTRLGQWVGSLSAYIPTVLRFGLTFLRLLGPIGLVITAATLLYQRWDDVVGGAKMLWEDLTSAIGSGLQAVMGLTSQFFNAGANIIQGLVSGITSRIAAVRDAVGEVASSSIGWFKEKLGIHSPSRVFAELGGYVGEGAAQGITGSSGLVRNAALGMAAATLVPMGAMALPMGGMLPMPDMASMAASAPAGGAAAGGGASYYTISITVQGNAKGDEIGAAVRAEIERIERQKAARRGSSLTDID
ncbi:phage tail tape measure protein [Comamonas piscis]|uniref:Phage tail tape measure protein n=1 Tax=Comamonas piscis TaxID=1562974 RepID=A0A7G5ELY7_9BURK|nr:phage tail tape measure protein [Comamonas piscis]QMV75012.1 phage tail tape measure protein [Comamonas piscis]WSO33492.1 phage tail tape measure protein [Comamonas piscis]